MNSSSAASRMRVRVSCCGLTARRVIKRDPGSNERLNASRLGAEASSSNAMTGSGLLELILISMGWLAFIVGLIAHWQILRQSLRAQPDERAPSNLGFIPGVVGS